MNAVIVIVILSVILGVVNILMTASSICMAVDKFKAGRYFSFGMFVTWAVVFAAFTVKFIVLA